MLEIKAIQTHFIFQRDGNPAYKIKIPRAVVICAKIDWMIDNIRNFGIIISRIGYYAVLCFFVILTCIRREYYGFNTYCAYILSLIF